MKGRLRWKKNPRATGLAAVGAGPRGSKYHDGETEYASVGALRKNYVVEGWYWVASNRPGIPYMNTCNEPCETEAEAKKQAQEYIKSCLKEAA